MKKNYSNELSEFTLSTHTARWVYITHSHSPEVWGLLEFCLTLFLQEYENKTLNWNGAAGQNFNTWCGDSLMM